MISTEHRGSLYAIISGFLYGFVGYFGISIVQSSISVTNMLFWRFLISSFIMGVLLIGQLKSTKNSRKDMFVAFINGAVFYGLSAMLYFAACPYIGSGLSMVIFFTYPAMVMLLNHFLYGQRIPTIYYYAIVIIIGGMSLFVDTNAMKFDLIGITISLLSAFLYAAYIISSKKINKLSPKISALMVCLGCMVTCLLLSLMNNSLTIPSTLPIWLNLFGISMLSTTAPILLLLYSLEYIKSEKAAILSVLEPVCVLVLGVTLLGEQMKIQYALGAFIVLSGAVLTLFSQRVNVNYNDNIKHRNMASLNEPDSLID